VTEARSEMWAALHEGELLTTDPDGFLYPGCAKTRSCTGISTGVTRQPSSRRSTRSCASCLPAERNIFGDRPPQRASLDGDLGRTVDHRGGAHAFGAAESMDWRQHLIERWQAIENGLPCRHYQDQSPGSKSWPAWKCHSTVMGELTVTVGTLCDGCAREISPGENVRYHLRIGSTYCQRCAAPFAQTGTGAG